MSSQHYSRVAAVAIGALALAGPLVGCGKDSEPSTAVADRLATTPTTGSSTSSTPTTSTEAEQRRAAARRAAKRAAARRAAAKRTRLRKQREARREQQQREQAATTTTPPATTASPEPTTPPATKPKPKPKPPASTGPAVHRITETATLKLVTKKGINFVQEGTVTGTVDGSMQLDAKLGGKGVQGTFVVTVKDGTLTGRAEAALKLDGSVARFSGTATLERGTGAYADLVPAQLAFSGSVASDASTSNVKLSGDVRY